MKFYRAWAIVVRQLYLFPRSLDRITDTFFWPVMDVVLYGLMTSWIASSQSNSDSVVLAVLTALLYWRIVWAASYEISVNILEECWNRNLTNICSSPLTKLEWLVGNLIVGFLKLVALVLIQSIAVWLLYSLNIFTLGWISVPFMASLTVSGWCMGAVAAGLILRLGIRAQAISWTLGFVLAPVCAAYFPLSMLPHWLRPLSLIFPMTYIMEGLRSIILENIGGLRFLIHSATLNAAYLAAAFWFLNACFEKTRKKGFDHLE